MSTEHSSNSSSSSSSGASSSSTVMPQTTLLPLNNVGIVTFLDAIDKYTIPDIEKLREIAIQSEQADNDRAPNDRLFGSQRCTTALASLCFATIEQLGLALRYDFANAVNPENVVKDALRSGNVKNAESFFNYARVTGLPLVDSSLLKAVYILFRNKITHNLFPKHNLGVCQNETNNLTSLIITINGIRSLNVNCLANYVLQVIPALRVAVNQPGNFLFVNMVANNLTVIDQAEEAILREEYLKTRPSYPNLQNELRTILPLFQF